MDFANRLNEYKSLVDEALNRLMPPVGGPQGNVAEAARYSLLADGKRLRPALVLEFYRVCGGHVRQALDFACGLEMIHAYSLIHDDLPCMDDDDMRRGRPSCHKAFGEATALLAGDTLLNRAFEVMLSAQDIPAQNVLRAAGYVAFQSGINGMIGGQGVDLAIEGQTCVDKALHNDMVSKKTAALFRAACASGCMLAGAAPGQVDAAMRFATGFGTAFQVIDDILDVTGDAKALGKPVGSDEKSGKATFVSLYGLEGSRRIAAQLLTETKEALDSFEDTHFLAQLCAWAGGRTN